MKILWVTNIILPYPASFFNLPITNGGGWMISSLNQFYKNKDYNIGVVSLYDGNIVKTCKDQNISYYLIPGKLTYKYQSGIEKYCEDILNEFDPDIIHLHGSEFSHGIAFIKTNKRAKIVLSIQGIASIIGRDYLLGLDRHDIIHSITIRDIIKHDNLWQQKKKFLKRGITEKIIFKAADGVIGRTEWDQEIVKSMNSKAVYYVNNESLRDSFYHQSWNINSIERYSIYVSQATYPIKGFHIFLKALNLVKKEYPEVKVYVAGQNITDKSTLTKRIKLSGYGKLLVRSIRKLSLSDNIVFLGSLSERECIKRMLSSHITVIPSILENSSNSLCEAMIIGLPSISSYVGGTPSIIDDGNTGFLYSCFDYEVLAGKIIEMFSNDALLKKISHNSMEDAKIRHNTFENFRKLQEIYNKVYFGG